MVEQSIPRLLLLGVLSIHLVKAQTGISVIPPEDLYENFVNIEDLNCLARRSSIDKCMEKSEFHTDYACRYDRRIRSRCYCCGANYKYIEYGNICTRFCLKSRPSNPEYGMYPIITLPFNWGDAGRPESASLEDGTDYPIIPVNARLSTLVYGFEPSEDIVPFSLGESPSFKNLGNDIGEALPAFTKQMFLQLAEDRKGKNLLFSPISLHSVLTLLSVGSDQDSKTKEELGDALGLTRNSAILENQYRKLTSFMKTQNEILYDNEIFISSKMRANTDYARNVFKNFGTNISYFLQDHNENSVKTINDIISRQTNGNIKSAIEELDYSTTMIMINTILFEGKWAVAFEDSKQKDTFKTTNGEKVVGMMKVFTEGIIIQKFKLGPVRNPIDFEMIKIPKIDKNNKNSNYEMRIVMGPAQFGEKGLEVLIDLMKKGGNIFLENNGEEIFGEVSLKMPKFSMSSKLDVSEFLKNIGVKSLFTVDAQLTKIADGPENLSVNKILQQVVLKVDKIGTEAAAATIVEIFTYSASDTFVRIVDRPFIIMLWDKVNSIPLIVGMINDPTLSN